MHVSILTGITLIFCMWFVMPTAVVSLVVRFIKWQDRQNYVPKVTVRDIYDAEGNLIRQETYVDGVPRILVGRLEEGF